MNGGLGILQQPVCLDNVEHWLDCGQLANERLRDFGVSSVSLEILTEDLLASVAHCCGTVLKVLNQLYQTRQTALRQDMPACLKRNARVTLYLYETH